MKKDTTIQIGVVGTGHLGNFHLKQLKGIPQFTVAGLFDSNPIRAKEMSQIHSVPAFSSLKDLLQKSEAISIVAPTPCHYEIGQLALEAGCHLFIEKPITDNIEHAGMLLNKAEKLNKIIQVGHI